MRMEWIAVGSWLLVAGVLTVLGAPLAAAIFERLPGRGGPFALHASLVVIGLASFWVGHLRYGWVALVASLTVLVGLSAIFYRRGYRPDWSGLTEGYVAFFGGFALAIAVRVTSNTIGPTGGEQFLHFGLLNAVNRAAQLPPEDMWWAGESVNYYYGGHVLVDQWSRLAGTEPRLAYNLGLAVTFGLAAAAAYGLVGAVVEGYGHRRRVGGALGVATLLLAGTLTTPVRLLLGHLPESFSTRFGEFAFQAIPSRDPLPEVIAEYGAISELSDWWWWFERRVVDGMLVETPLYSLLKADLHGHVTTIPFMVMLIGVAYAYYQTPAEERLRRWALLVGVFPALTGLVGWMNTWSLPGAVGIAWLAIAFAAAHPLSLFGDRFQQDVSVTESAKWVRAEVSRLVGATAGAFLVGLLGIVWITPFVLFQLPSNDGIGILPERSPFGPHFLLFGGFFVLFGLFLGLALWRRYVTDEQRDAVIVAVVVTVLAGGLLFVAGLGSLAVALPLVILSWWLLRRHPSVGFIGVLIVGTLGLILAMELVYAEVWPPERQRLNTTYKVSMQAMVFGLLALASIATVLLSDQVTRLRDRNSATSIGIVLVVIVVLLMLATFPALTLTGEFGDFLESHPNTDTSVDALSGHDRWNANQMEGIYWLQEQSGNPVLLEAPGEQIYTWANPASTFTGLPSVLGWAHERGYRGIEAYYDRQEDVDTIFRRDVSLPVDLLLEYEVDYIWVGEPEHDRYGDLLRDFGEHPAITVAFSNIDVTIYEVDRDALDHSDSGS